MPIHYQINADENLITVTISGTIQYDELLSAFDARTKEETYRPGMNLLCDGREARLDFSTSDVINLVEAMAVRREERGEGFRFALVGGSDLTYGMGKVFQGYAVRLPENIRVFRDFEEARRWVMESQ